MCTSASEDADPRQATHLKGRCRAPAAFIRVELEAEHALHCMHAESLD